MFFLLLRMLYEELEQHRMTYEEYCLAVERVALIHGIRRNRIR